MQSDIKLLDSIPKFITYSKAGMSLDRQFEVYSLKYLINQLKNPKDSLTSRNVTSPNKTKEKKKEEIDIFEIEEPKIENIKITNTDNTNNKRLRINSALKEKIEAEMSPCKYYPNYNSIFKNVPYVKIVTPKNKNIKLRNISVPLTRRNNTSKNLNDSKNQEDFNEKILSRENSYKSSNKNKNNKEKNNENFIQINENDNSNKNKNNENEESKDKNILKLPVIGKKINDNSFSFGKPNHALRFSKYNGRKLKFREASNVVSYIEPYNYAKNKNNNAINFRKMKNRPPLLNEASLFVPNPCYYEPKYSILDKNISNVQLSKDPIIKKSDHRKYLIKKICSSYYVDPTYHIIDNNKLKE